MFPLSGAPRDSPTAIITRFPSIATCFPFRFDAFRLQSPRHPTEAAFSGATVCAARDILEAIPTKRPRERVAGDTDCKSRVA